MGSPLCEGRTVVDVHRVGSTGHEGASVNVSECGFECGCESEYECECKCEFECGCDMQDVGCWV